MPQQHLYGSSPPIGRPVYNTLEFQNGTSEPDTQKTVIAEAARVVSDMARSGEKQGAKAKKGKRKKKILKKTHSVDTPNTVSDTANATPPTHGTEQNSKHKKKKKSRDSTHVFTPKRKRESEMQDELLQGSQSDNAVVGVRVPQNVDARMDGLLVEVEQIPRPNRAAGEPLKKKPKIKRKSEVLLDNKRSQEKADSSPVKPANKVVSGESALKKKSNISYGRQTKDSASREPSTTSSPYVRELKHTPVPLPLPHRSSLRTTTNVGSPEQRHVQEDEVLVTETPPRKVPRRVVDTRNAPVPFALSQTVERITIRKMSKKAPDILLSSPTSDEGDQLPVSIPSAPLEKRKDTGELDSHMSLTSSSLMQYTQPLSDEPKARPRRAASVSSASSMSIKDAMSRMGKPSPGLNTNDNHFLVSDKKACETHEDADKRVFEKSFHAVQQTVNFTKEFEHLHAHLHWRTENEAAGPLPCLKKATGCSPKSEQIMRLLGDDTTSGLLKLTVSTDTERIVFDAAVRDSLAAEKFLHNAVVAKVPVSTGKLEGVYTLYCPKYAQMHIDKYGFGQRTLSISRPSGFTSNTYTARLSTPPRPMAYTILAFTPPPHASFRTTVLITSAERYTMALVCLGNGYLLLRVDLALLLTGKKSKVYGDVSMEFLCVRERDVGGCAAVKWGALEANVTAARKVMEAEEAKENSSAKNEKVEKKRIEEEEEEKEEKEEEEKAAMLNSSPKKRGRPSNAERARRAQEKETLARGHA
jgi:hypothetical protein